MNTASAIKTAEGALNKGEYSYCIKLIEPLLVNHSAETSKGAQLRLLVVTAYMGNGNEKEAIETCRLLLNHKEIAIRQQSKQLLSILEAPCLPRPSTWSVEIPNLEINPSFPSTFRKTLKKKKGPPPPSTGPTRNLDLGFSIFVLIILFAITFLLSGCVNISTKIDLTGADKLNLSLDINSHYGNIIPWQLEFEKNLKANKNDLRIKKDDNKIQHFESKTIRVNEANKLLIDITSAAANASGINITNPKIFVENKNWIIGIKQKFKFYFDLREIPKIPGLDLTINMKSSNQENKIHSKPLTVSFDKGFLSWHLQEGEINQLEVYYWKWNRIFIGIILIFSITLFSILLQRLRLQMGFGFPELPP